MLFTSPRNISTDDSSSTAIMLNAKKLRVSKTKKPCAPKARNGPKQKPGPRGGHHDHPIHLCMICEKGYSRRSSVKEPHFASCVRKNGNPHNYLWDTHPSCWRLNEDGPSGEIAPGTDENGQLIDRYAKWHTQEHAHSAAQLKDTEMENDEGDVAEEVNSS